MHHSVIIREVLQANEEHCTDDKRMYLRNVLKIINE